MCLCACLFSGKGKTPLRRSNNVALSVSVDKTKVQVSDSSCEKSCQVTSEQIKADMKAAADNSRRTSSKGITTESRETTPRADSWTEQSSGSTGAAARTELRQVTGSVVRNGAGAATSRQVDRCGRVVVGMSHRTITTTENTSGALTGNTRDSGMRLSSSPASLEPSGAAVDHASRRPALVGQGESQHVPDTGSGSQHAPARDEDFVPRRPLTRSCTRMSSVSLVPETGKTEVTNTEHTWCVHWHELKECVVFSSKGLGLCFHVSAHDAQSSVNWYLCAASNFMDFLFPLSCMLSLKEGKRLLQKHILAV